MYDGIETLMSDGEWVVRRVGTKTWVSHIECRDKPRRVTKGRCHVCQAHAPELMMGFLSMLEWKR